MTHFLLPAFADLAGLGGPLALFRRYLWARHVGGGRWCWAIAGGRCHAVVDLRIGAASWKRVGCCHGDTARRCTPPRGPDSRLRAVTQSELVPVNARPGSDWLRASIGDSPSGGVGCLACRQSPSGAAPHKLSPTRPSAPSQQPPIEHHHGALIYTRRRSRGPSDLGALRAVYFSSSLAAGPPFAIYNPASALNISLLTPHYRTIAST